MRFGAILLMISPAGRKWMEHTNILERKWGKYKCDDYNVIGQDKIAVHGHDKILEYRPSFQLISLHQVSYVLGPVGPLKCTVLINTSIIN